MKKNIYIHLLLIVITVGLTSCARRFGSANDFSYLRQGFSFSKIDSTFEINDKDLYPTYDFEFDNQKYQSVVLTVTNYIHKSTSSNPQTGTTTNRTHAFQDPFFLIFNDRKLYSWGYLYEYKNSTSNKTGQFGLAIEDGYKYYLKSKGIDYEK